MAASRRAATNILITCATDEILGGVRVACQDLVRTLERSGRRVHLIYPAPASHLRLTRGTNSWGREAFFCPMPVIISGAAWLSIPVFLLYLPLTLFHLRRVVRRNRIDVINCHYLAPHFIHLLVVAWFLRRRLVISVHGSDIASYASADWLHRLACRTVLKHADAVIACSDALAEETSSIVPGIHDKIVRIHNAVDVSRCSQTRERRRGLPEPFVLFVGRHVALKGIDILLRAFALIANEAIDLSLVLVGDGPLLAEHKQLAVTLGVAARVHFVGEVSPDDVGSFLARCAVFALPSRSEAFGLVLLEAAFHSKPIVCTRVGGVPEVITDGVSGLIVEPEDPVALGQQILAIVGHPDMAVRMGAEARRMVTSRFLWQDRIGDYIAVYEGTHPADVDAPRDYSGRHRVASGIKSTI